MAQVILNLELDEILRAFTTGAKNEGFRLLLQKGLNAMLERESSEQLGAKRYERTEERTDSRNGVRTRELKTRIGRLTLNVPRHRNQPFRTMLFENYSRQRTGPSHDHDNHGSGRCFHPEDRPYNGRAVRNVIFEISCF